MKAPLFIRERIQHHERQRKLKRYINWRASELGISPKDYKKLLQAVKRGSA